MGLNKEPGFFLVGVTKVLPRFDCFLASGVEVFRLTNNPCSWRRFAKSGRPSVEQVKGGSVPAPASVRGYISRHPRVRRERGFWKAGVGQHLAQAMDDAGIAVEVKKGIKIYFTTETQRHRENLLCHSGKSRQQRQKICFC